ncbi:beta strand repeat-containing protein [Haloferula sp.]|uniref:beta strand repeat-containing protein n=1 Tax=Haloferula sp. TaxID=2497595 RepID=UPI0032A10E5F
MLTIAAILPMAASGQTTYTWTGAALDGDWDTTGNWDANLVPADDGAADGLTLPAGDQVIFNATMPTLNVPGYGGEYDGGSNGGTVSTPSLVLNSGGSLTMAIQSGNRGLWTNLGSFDRDVLTVGDGVGAAGEVTLTFTNNFDRMGRHNNGTHNIRVNSDGILNLSFGSRWANSSARPVKFFIDGGTVTASSAISGTNYNDAAWNFASIGGSVTAEYGGNHPDLASVDSALGTKFVKTAPDSLFQITEDLVSVPNTFTVTVIQAPDPNYWTGTGGANWDDATTLNFTTNNEVDPLVVDTFANATASSLRATFADEYFNSSAPVGVVQSTINIAAGGVSTDNVDFSADSVAYNVSSPDTNGIAGSTKLNLTGTAAVTLTGEHATSGNTTIASGSTLNLGDGATDGSLPNSAIGNSGTLNFNNSALLTRDSAISGGGAVNKSGAGTLTITENTSTTGGSNVTGGTVLFEGVVDDEVTPFGGAIDIAAGSTYEITANATTSGNLEMPSNTFTGGGTLRVSGGQLVRWGGAALTMSMGSGALIDVQGPGRFRAGSNANDSWPGNLADLNIGIDGFFTTDEAPVEIDALTGDGLLTNGSGNSNYMPLSIGNDNGTGTFDGVIDGALGSLVKQGSGTQTLNGANTFGTDGGTVVVNGGALVLGGTNAYNGGTTVGDATLTLDVLGSLTFVPTANNTVNGVVGTGDNTTGTVNLNGQFFIDLSSATAGVGNTWTLVDPTLLSSVSYDPFDFYIDSTLGFFDFDGGGMWSLVDGIALWQFDEATGVLTYNVGADARLWVGNNGGGLWDQMTTLNWMDNAPSDPLVETDYMTAESFSGTVGFADNYFNSGAALPVGTSSVSIAAGGISGDTVGFLNSGTTYTVTSSDAFGIAGSTNVNVSGSGTVIFQGDHASSGTTTVNTNLTFDTSLGDATYLATLTGIGNIEKTGANTQTLPASNTYIGSTTISGGTLKFTNDSASSAVNIASGATLEIDWNNRWGAGPTTFSGTGTLAKTGPNGINFDTGTFVLGAGSDIDVQEGSITAGSSRNDNWDANLSSLNIAAGARFQTNEADVYVDGLTGDGTLVTGFGEFDDPTYDQFTIGVNNGTAIFDGDLIERAVFDMNPAQHWGVLHKVGTGSQTLNGIVSLRGNYDVQDGTVTLGTTGSITFHPQGNGATNQVIASVDTGTPVINLDGAINFELDAADTTPANAWTILDPTNFDMVNVGATATVTSNLGAFTETVADTTFELDAGGNLWTFDVASATLTVAEGTPVGGFDNYMGMFTLVDDTVSGDDDKDNLVNLLEYVFDGDPSASDLNNANLPVADASGANYVFTFTRRVESTLDTTQTFEYGSDLTGWTPIAVNDDTAPEVSIAAAVGDVETVTVTVAKSSFADPTIGFGRLDVTLP